MIEPRELESLAELLLDLVEKRLAPDWITTEQAAEELGISRTWLDEVGPAAARACPGAVLQVGSSRRRNFRWDRRRLGEALSLVHELPGEQPASKASKPARRKKPADEGDEVVDDWAAKARELTGGQDR